VHLDRVDGILRKNHHPRSQGTRPATSQTPDQFIRWIRAQTAVDTRNFSSLPKLTDPGFQRPHFAEALNAVRRLPVAEFTAYGLRADEARRLVDRMVEWAASLR